MLSSKSFIVPGLTFRSLLHFECIFVYDVRECSNFILLHVAVFPESLIRITGAEEWISDLDFFYSVYVSLSIHHVIRINEQHTDTEKINTRVYVFSH